MSQNQGKASRTCLISLLVLFVFGVCCLLVGGGFGYYMYSTGRVELNDFLRWVGMGPAEIQIINLSDSTLYTELIYFDEQAGDTSTHASADLSSYDISSISNLSSGRYQLNFSSAIGLPKEGTCWMNIRGGEEYRFVAVPDGIAVVLAGKDVGSVEEINIFASELCQP